MTSEAVAHKKSILVCVCNYCDLPMVKNMTQLHVGGYMSISTQSRLNVASLIGTSLASYPVIAHAVRTDTAIVVVLDVDETTDQH